MKKIGIICAGDAELEPFLPHIEIKTKTKKAMIDFIEGKIDGMNVVTLFCGVCKTNAAIATQILIDTYKADVIINAGTAGGMNPDLDLFDTVISTEVAHHDVHEGILTEFHPWLESAFIKSDKTLLELSKNIPNPFRQKHKLFYGRMVTGESFITDEGRNAISVKFEPLSVDMETASIAQVCYVNNIPFISIRSLTDTAKHSGVDNFEKNCVLASAVSKDVVLELLSKIKNHLNKTING